MLILATMRPADIVAQQVLLGVCRCARLFVIVTQPPRLLFLLALLSAPGSQWRHCNSNLVFRFCIDFPGHPRACPRRLPDVGGCLYSFRPNSLEVATRQLIVGLFFRLMVSKLYTLNLKRFKALKLQS